MPLPGYICAPEAPVRHD